jgi:hypothetical protein
MRKLLFVHENLPVPVVAGFVLTLVFLVQTTLFAQNQVVEKHFGMIGEVSLQQLRTACIKGRYVPLTMEPVTFVAYLKFPDKIKIEWTQGRVKWTDTYANGRAVSRLGGVTTELEGKESFDLLWMLRSTSPLREAGNGQFSLSAEKWNNREFYKLATGTEESQLEFLVDKGTYEIVLERIISVSKSSKKDVQEIKYLRYMDLGGVKVPAVFVMDTEEGSADLIYDEVLLGYPLNDSFFN